MKRFFKSISFIEANMYEKISIHEIAAASHYSTYHFCRIFRALVGDSPKEYLRKRRLTLAAQKLLKQNSSIIELSLDCQFESQEAFTRAFKAYFGTTPAKYRKESNGSLVLNRDKFTPEQLDYLQNNISMEPEIIQHPELKIVGIKHQYKQADLDLNKLWNPFLQFTSSEHIPNVIGAEGFGIYEKHNEVKDEISFSYICALEVANFDDVLPNMVSRIIPEQKYAKFRHNGSLENLNETLKYIWGSWLPKSKFEYVEKPDFELYPRDFDDTDPNNKIFLHIPIGLK